MTQVLRYSKFESRAEGHGGHRRTAQISELIHSAGLGIHEISQMPSTPIQRYLHGLRFLAQYRPRFHISRPTISGCGQQYLSCLQALDSYSGKKIMVWEMTLSHVAPYLAKDRDFKLIALPHNLESLVTDYIDPLTSESLPASFESEIKHLAQADRIFCIAREEQWLLKLRGIEADYLPYYPVQSILSELLSIRHRRQSSEKQRFLVLGSADNLPTLTGMIEQLQWLETISQTHPMQIDIAGYGTEALQHYCDRPNVHLLGSVDPDKLDYLLTHAQAILVHQKAGVGALTRIPEMLIAGVPVIANSNACRSAFDYSGVYCYDSPSELLHWMNQSLPDPEMLNRPIKAEQRFVECLNHLAD
jgi:glycosyltransferase involved in cell wall biosynthesis